MFRRFMMNRATGRRHGMGYRRRGRVASFGTTLLVVCIAVILILYFMGYLAL
ncbi:MAG TPA: hypothetical protein VEZ20_15600 [Allosphingosinicella sp.]|nr:hypothetical protein [Allosphingosinicella sp.]